jgi:hypothetical protein
MAAVNRMNRDKPAQPERNLAAEREEIMEKVFDLIQSLLPEDGKGMPPQGERDAASIHDSISRALGIKP